MATRHEYLSILTLNGWSQPWSSWSNSAIAVERRIVLIEHRVASAEMALLPSSRDLACRHGTPVHGERCRESWATELPDYVENPSLVSRLADEPAQV
jgi:hypothetical protein